MWSWFKIYFGPFQRRLGSADQPHVGPPLPKSRCVSRTRRPGLLTRSHVAGNMSGLIASHRAARTLVGNRE